MPPLVRAGLAAALFAALSVMTDRPPRTVRVGVGAKTAASAPGLSALCPRGTLPDGNVCVPVPERGARDAGTAGRPRAEADRILRRPDRPADFSKYRFPIELMKSTEPTGTLVPAARGTAVRLVRLEHQEGEAEVLFAGELPGVAGRTVVTRHSVRDTSGLREYLAVYASLERIEPAVAPGAAPRDGEKLGSVGDAAAPGAPALDFEIRRLRSGVDVRSLAPADFVADARTVGCDARNVLPLK